MYNSIKKIWRKEMTILKKDSLYIFPKAISVNLHQSSIDKFLSSKRLYSAYKAVDKSNNYIGDLINEGKIDHDDLNSFLFKELFYGHHKVAYITKITNCKLTEVSIRNIIRERYSVNIPYNKLSLIYYTGSERKENRLAAVEFVKENNKVVKIRLIYVEKVEVYQDGLRVTENSYVPIEVDLERQLIIARVYPKSYVVDDGKRYYNLAMRHIKTIAELFNVRTVPYGHRHKEILYNIYNFLVDEVMTEINKITEHEQHKMQGEISRFSGDILDILGMKSVALSRRGNNNIYDIEMQISRVIQNMLISDVLHNAEKNKDGLTGQISFINYNDGNMVKATLKAKSRKDTLFGSDAYFGLRQSIDNRRIIEQIKVVWYINQGELQVGYYAIDLDLLEIHFFEKLSEDDFYYALEKYEEHE